ncbi:MAG: endolytic transglycosylase MltG [Chloroflexota bacterium]
MVLILALCGSVGLVTYSVWSLHKAQGSDSRSIALRVGSGDTVTSIANRLHRQGIVDNALLFRLDARLHSLGSKLKVGVYSLRPNMSIDEMVAALSVYRSPTITITIPEGYRKEQIASVLQRHGIDGTSFLHAVDNPTLSYSILSDKPRGASLEGYLFPSTYKIPPNFTGRQFVEVMVRQLAQEFTRSMRRMALKHGLSIYDALTLASIVERETPDPNERRLVAGVYASRLRLHMFLDADPTIQYSLGSRRPWTRGVSASPRLWWPVLTSQQQYQLQLSYNTYIHSGLPPGPIANPGLASIVAAVSPANTTYLYFVARGNGHHAFARTLAEQTANIQKFSQH